MDERKYSSKKRTFKVLGTTSGGLVLSKRRRLNSGVRYRNIAPSHGKQLKCVDITGAPVAAIFSTTLGLALCNATNVGSNINNRLGRKIRMRSLHVQGMIQQYQGGASPGDDYVHLMVVYDKQPNGAVPAAADLFQNVDPGGPSITTAWAFLNPSNFERFKVLRHYKAKMEYSVSSSELAHESTDYKKDVSIDWHINLRGLETQYNAGTAGTVADQVSGSLLLVSYGLQTAANSQYQFIGNTRLRFEDL